MRGIGPLLVLLVELTACRGVTMPPPGRAAPISRPAVPVEAVAVGAAPSIPAARPPTALDAMAPVPSELYDGRLLGLTRMGARRVLVFSQTTRAGAAVRYSLRLAELSGRALSVVRAQTLDLTETRAAGDAQWEGLLAPSLRDNEPPASYGSEWAAYDGVSLVSASVRALAAAFGRPQLVPLGGQGAIVPSEYQCGYGVVPPRGDWFVDGGLHGIVGNVWPSACGRGVVYVSHVEPAADGRSRPRYGPPATWRYARSDRELIPVDLLVHRTRGASAVALWRRAGLAPEEFLDVAVFDAAFRPRWRRSSRAPTGAQELTTHLRAMELREAVLRVATLDSRFADGPRLVLTTFDARGAPRTRTVDLGERDFQRMIVCGGAAWALSDEDDSGRRTLGLRRFDFASGGASEGPPWVSPPLPAGMAWHLGPLNCEDGRVTLLVSLHDEPVGPEEQPVFLFNWNGRTRAVEVVSWR